MIFLKDNERKSFSSKNKLKKGYNSQNYQWILSKIELELYFMFICLYMKYECNTVIFSKDNERKSFSYGMDGRDGRMYGQR